MPIVDYTKKIGKMKSDNYRTKATSDNPPLSHTTGEYMLGTEYIGNSFTDRIFSNWSLFSSRNKNSTSSFLFLYLENLILMLYEFLSAVYGHSNFAKRNDIEPMYFDKDDDGDLSLTWKVGTSLLIATVDPDDFSWTLQKKLLGSLVEMRFVTGSINDINESILLLINELKGVLN